jgi:phosphate transport system substrate-binding protein
MREADRRIDASVALVRETTPSAFQHGPADTTITRNGPRGNGSAHTTLPEVAAPVLRAARRRHAGQFAARDHRSKARDNLVTTGIGSDGRGRVTFNHPTHWSVRVMRAVVAVLTLAAVLGCGGGEGGEGGGRSRGVDLTGAGATFPYPIYSKWFNDYARDRGVRINYQSIGSGGGVRQLSEGTVDFGATDGPMNDAELARAKGGEILHIPTVIGAVVAAYNLDGVSDTLHLTGDVLADVFLGRITKWNDSRIVAVNSGVTLPNQDIIVVHRSDGSGTTYVFTDYLAKVSEAWANGPGRGKEVQWPVGLGGKGNEGVAGQVKQTPGSIGYVELAYATQNNLAYASIRNQAGQFVSPSIESISAAASGAMEQLGPDTDFRVSIADASGAMSYPISSFTWIILYKNQPDAEKGRKLVDFLEWAVTDGQQAAAGLDYAPLPDDVVQTIRARLQTVQLGGAA